LIGTLKKAARSVLNRLGYDLVRKKYSQSLAADLAWCLVMRKIHRNDAVQIEELYRQFVFANLPSRDGRADLLNELIGTSVGEAIYIIHHLHDALKNPGDVCEFGVGQGATSAVLAAEILSISDRKLWLFDSFEGLPTPGPEDKLIDDIFNLGSMSSYAGEMASPEQDVRNKLAAVGFPESRTKVKKGWVKETIKRGDVPDRVAFAYVDLDFYDPIKEALEFLDGRMQIGARIVVDDYGFFSAGAQQAVDQFVAKKKGSFQIQAPLPHAGHFCILSKVS
jgi:O-methyltransferase